MTIIRLLSPALVVLFCWVASASAQNVTPATPVPTVRARLYFLSVDRSPIEGLAFANAKDFTDVVAPSDFVSQPVDYEGPAALVIGPRTDLIAAVAARANGVPVKPPAPGSTTTATLPVVEAGEWLVLLGYRQGPLQAMVLDFSPAALPQDSYLFWNLTTRQLGVMLGSSRALVGAGQRQMLRAPEGADYIPLRVFENHDAEVRQAFASRHLHRAGRRQLVLLSDGAEPGRIRLRMVTQQIAVIRPVVPPAAGTR